MEMMGVNRLYLLPCSQKMLPNNNSKIYSGNIHYQSKILNSPNNTKSNSTNNTEMEAQIPPGSVQPYNRTTIL